MDRTVASRTAVRGLLLVLVLSLTGCGIFGKNETVQPPAELVPFEATVKAKKLWSIQVDKADEDLRLALRPALLDDRLVVASSRGEVRAVDRDRGRSLWQRDLDVVISGAVAADDELVVVGTLDGEVIALSTQSGDRLWQAQASSEILAPAAIGSESVVVRSQDGRVFGYDRETGARRWVSDQSTPTLTLRGNSAPTIAGGFVFIGFDNGKLVALRERDGSLAWDRTLGVPSGRSELDRMVDIDGQLAVVGRDLYAVGFQGRLMSMSADAGQVTWNRDFSSSTGVAVLRRQLFVADDEDGVWALDRFSGGTLWRQDRMARRELTAPAPQNGTVLVGDFDGYLHWLSAEDGSFVGRVRAADGPIRVAPIVAGDTVYVISQRGRLIALRVS